MTTTRNWHLVSRNRLCEWFAKSKRSFPFSNSFLFFPYKTQWNASALSCTHHAVSIQLPISIPRYDKFMLLTDPSANSNSDTDTEWRHRPKRYLPVITDCCTSRLLGQISPANFSLVPCDLTKPLKILRMPARVKK
ncbi:hypothetical protein ALC53_02358 [Atta colombica]|uniref:Uncharacterized protein n=1 Tax=Atta colombica TaxID=520822 RepID=A0A195BSM4_9HYME|nr:hypothetical protein ALC53_02358 [Atta colombica]